MGKKLNESRKHKKKPMASRGGTRTNQQNFNNKFVLPSTGMNLAVSDRFKYILTKISELGNRIAKDFLTQLEDKDKKYAMSYFDLAKNADTLSYLPSGGSHLPEDQKYNNNKRQFSKVYKIIKTIFGNKYTKTDVTKFVSLFKSVYSKGPDKNDTGKPTDEQIIKKITEDTKSNKLKWNMIMSATQWIKYESRYKATDKKGVAFILHIFRNNENIPEQKTWTFLTTNFYNDVVQDKEKKCIPIDNYKYEEIKDLLDHFIEKYKVPV